MKSKFIKKCRLIKAQVIVSILIFVLQNNSMAQNDNLALTPPMGWNSWNKFGCDVSENLIREVADAMITSGMKDAGYEFVVIDDCWQIGRDSEGNIVPDPKRFPSGMKALADYIHSKGLKFGIYSDAGMKTCQGRPGSRGYEFQDARQYAAWGVDYLKYDWCSHGTQNAAASYKLMREALDKSGRPIILSICEWGTNKPWLWGEGIGHLWRTTEDIQDCWDCKRKWGGMGFIHILDLQDGLESYAGPGHWNDPDMLEIGNDSLTLTESMTHFSLWCLLAAPLMAGNDLRSMSPEITEVLTNREVIAVNQDSLGRQGHKVRDDGDFEVWSKDLKDGSKAVILLNRSEVDANISVAWSEIGYPDYLSSTVRDLWMKKDLGKFNNGFSSIVPPHGVVMIKVKP
jgi:alpha-galactosidase